MMKMKNIVAILLFTATFAQGTTKEETDALLKSMFEAGYKPFSLNELPDCDPRILNFYLLQNLEPKFHPGMNARAYKTAEVSHIALRDNITKEQTKRDCWWRKKNNVDLYDNLDFEQIGKSLDNSTNAHIINQCAYLELLF